MKLRFAIITCVFAFGLCGAAAAQTKGEAIAIDATDAVVTVLEVDQTRAPSPCADRVAIPS